MIATLPLYEPGYILDPDEFVLKVQGVIQPPGRNRVRNSPTGFLCKLKKDHTLMKSFQEWAEPDYGYHYSNPTKEKQFKLPIYVFKEDFNEGWELKEWRFGQSQNWATLVHPFGFTVEIYLEQFLEIVKNCDIEKGKLIGSFKWQDKKLIARMTY